MIHRIQIVVTISLIAAGAAFLFASFSAMWNAAAFAMYAGWFLTAFSFVAFFLLAILSLIRRARPNWGDVATANFGLSLIAWALIGDPWRYGVAMILLAFVVALGLAYVATRTAFFARSAGPAISLGIAISLALVPNYWSLQLTCWGLTMAFAEFMAMLGRRTGGL